MDDKHQRPFSNKWMFASMGVFIGIELVLGGMVGGLLVGRFTSVGLRLVLQGSLYLASFFIGGFIIGLVSPSLRILEPAAGAFLSVALMLVFSIFTPFTFIRFSLVKMFVGGAIAVFLALTGAKIGERITGHRTPD